MFTLKTRRRIEFAERRKALARSLDQTRPGSIATFVREYRALCREYSNLFPADRRSDLQRGAMG